MPLRPPGLKTHGQLANNNMVAATPLHLLSCGYLQGVYRHCNCSCILRHPV